MKSVHDRMPVILPTEETQQNWLSDISLEKTLSLLQPLSEGYLEVFPVSPKVNSPGYNEPDLYQPIQLPPTLF